MPIRDRSKDTILQEKSFLHMGYSAQDSLIHLQWMGHARSDEYRSSLEQALEFVVKNDVRFWIADLRKMTVILKDDETWANEVWFPKLFKTGLEKMAILESEDYFNKTSVQRSFTALKGQISFEVAWFPSYLQAIDWLNQQELINA